MPRRTRRPITLVLALVGVVVGVVLAACQDYNFSPVRYCLIQPGTERVTLSDISTADILFVVDDSGSMGGEQQKLAASFDAFVNSLKASNVARVASRLEPIDFHIAVTTTSVFLNSQLRATCSTGCGGAVGQQVCCDADTSQPVPVPRGCSTAADCGPGRVCSEECLGRAGEKTCCTGPGGAPETTALACSEVGAACGKLRTRYEVSRAPRLCRTVGGITTSCTVGPDGTSANPAPAGYACLSTCQGLGGTSACCSAAGSTWSDPTCDLGVGTEGGLYPRGDFVRKGSNPRVLHFDKSLFCARSADGTTCACTGAGAPATCDPPVVNDAAIATLIGQFQQNIAVGTCGSGQEQGLEAARRAIEKALGLSGQVQPTESGGAAPEWPHPRRVVVAGEKATSKLVVVFVGDEDDCSSPEDVTRGIIFANSGNDACEVDGNLPPEQQRRFKLQQYADFLTSLGRPVAGAFIVSAKSETCVDQACVANICCDTVCTGDVNVCTQAGLCGGQGAGFRFVDLEKLLRGKAADTVLGSVCSPGTAQKPGFSSILERVAEVVKQPAGLQLPTQPASAQLTLLRIAAPDGKTRKTCVGPAPAASLPPETDPGFAAAVVAAVNAAKADGQDWWFTGGDDTNQAPSGPSRFIFLNLGPANRNCEANPGETYSADYLGLVPAAGCSVTDLALGRAECQAALGGRLEDWTCDPSGGGARGTCLCGTF